MARKSLVKTADAPYHITARSNNKEFFYIALAELWKIFMECFNQAQEQYSCKLHAFVLMSNHYHLLISTPHSNIDEVMHYIQREVARRANKLSARVNHFFGGRYKWSVVNTENYYWNAVKYIFRNPVRADLCQRVENYSFSSLNTMAQDFNWSMTDFFHNQNTTITPDLDWLNEAYPQEIEDGIRSALRRSEFTLPRNKSSCKTITLNEPRFKK
ncbi:MAG: transposase [Pseudobdellovibrio sp.]|nr:transposase [Pseudobdellovibrio sp.]